MSYKNFFKNLFTFFSKNLFFLLYGKVSKIIKPSEDKRIKVDEIIFDGKIKYSIFTILSGRIYTDTIHDTAVILDNSLVKGPSFQLRNNRNSDCAENVVFKKGTTRIKKNIKGTVLSLLTGGGGNENYWHWLFDVLPRLEMLNNILKKEKIDFFLFPNIKKRFQIETLDILGIDKKKRLSSQVYRHLTSDKIIITDRPTICNENLKNDEWQEEVPFWIIEYLRKSFLKKEFAEDDNFPKKIYIDRSDAGAHRSKFRAIKNEAEVKKILESNGYKSLRIADYNFKDQVKLFSNAKEIAGLHGGGFANLIFCPPSTKVIEFKNKTTGNIIGDLAQKNNLNYNTVIGETENSVKYSQQGIMEISISDLKEKLN